MVSRWDQWVRPQACPSCYCYYCYGVRGQCFGVTVRTWVRGYSLPWVQEAAPGHGGQGLRELRQRKGVRAKNVRARPEEQRTGWELQQVSEEPGPES